MIMYKALSELNKANKGRATGLIRIEEVRALEDGGIFVICNIGCCNMPLEELMKHILYRGTYITNISKLKGHIRDINQIFKQTGVFIMSVTFHLFKVVDETMIFGKYAYMTPTERMKFNEKVDSIELSEDLIEKYFGDEVTNASNYNHPTILDLELENDKSARRLNRCIMKMRKLYKSYIKYSPHPESHVPYIIVDEICYRQGWFLTKKFFKLKHTVVFSFTKEDMIKKIKLYVEPSHHSEFDEFIEKYEDGMIFSIQF